MNIIRAEVLGFCFGVRRAIELAEAALSNGEYVTTLGPLVHNPQETQRLAGIGIHAADVPERVASGTVVIRAHGARPEIFTLLRESQRRIIDATCPFVGKSQRIARELVQKGYTLVIVGHPNHPEVQGILGYVSTPAYVISTPDEVRTLPAAMSPGVIAQTTVNEATFLQVVEAIIARYPHHAIHNTVCSATRERQQAAMQLAVNVDTVYVVGGRESSNTNRLAEICRSLCPKTFLIETADEINPANLTGIQTVGVTAGASTPKWLIDRVVERLEQIGNTESLTEDI